MAVVTGSSRAVAQAATYARRYGFTDTDGREIAPFLLPDTLRLRTSAPS